MQRICNGTDECSVKLAAAPNGQLAQFRACECGLNYDDSDRLLVYPHKYYRVSGDTVTDLAGQPLDENETREHLTIQRVFNYTDVSNRRPSERKLMSDGTYTGEHEAQIEERDAENGETEQERADREAAEARKAEAADKN